MKEYLRAAREIKRLQQDILKMVTDQPKTSTNTKTRSAPEENAPGNVHRICDYCHNTWHALNDPGYGPRPDHTLPFVPIVEWKEHDATTKATQQEIIEAETKRLIEL